MKKIRRPGGDATGETDIDYMDRHRCVWNLSSWFARPRPSFAERYQVVATVYRESPPPKPKTEGEKMAMLVGTRVSAVVESGDDIQIHFSDGRHIDLGYHDWAWDG